MIDICGQGMTNRTGWTSVGSLLLLHMQAHIYRANPSDYVQDGDDEW